jgi:hypothetical protein
LAQSHPAVPAPVALLQASLLAVRVVLAGLPRAVHPAVTGLTPVLPVVLVPMPLGLTGSIQVSLLIVLAARGVPRADHLSEKGRGIARRSVQTGRVAIQHFVPINQEAVLRSARTVRIVVQPNPAFHSKKVKLPQPRRGLLPNVLLTVRIVLRVGRLSAKGRGIVRHFVQTDRVAVRLFVPINQEAVHPSARTVRIAAQPSPALHPKRVKPF